MFFNYIFWYRPYLSVIVIMSEWSCQTCTFLNPASQNKCEMCMADREQLESDEAAELKRAIAMSLQSGNDDVVVIDDSEEERESPKKPEKRKQPEVVESDFLKERRRMEEERLERLAKRQKTSVPETKRVANATKQDLSFFGKQSVMAFWLISRLQGRLDT